MLRLLAVWLAVCGNALAPQRKRAPQRPRGQGTDATQTQASADAAQTQALTDAARPRARAALSRKAAPPAVPRRVWLRSVAGLAVASSGPAFANDEYFDDRPDLQEVSGLVVLRVAEVAAFQEQLLREVAKGTDLGVPVTPQQFMFGTELLLRNSNLDGNMKLMIATEIPKAKREAAIKQAPRVMNALLAISAEAAKVETPQLRPKDASALADLYRQLRGELLAMFAFLPEDLQSKYQGYATVLSKYEKDISRNCEGGVSGGCVDLPAAAAEKESGPTAGRAPQALRDALEAEKRSPPAPPAPPASSFGAAKPARGSFAEMASRY